MLAAQADIFATGAPTAKSRSARARKNRQHGQISAMGYRLIALFGDEYVIEAVNRGLGRTRAWTYKVLNGQTKPSADLLRIIELLEACPPALWPAQWRTPYSDLRAGIVYAAAPACFEPTALQPVLEARAPLLLAPSSERLAEPSVIIEQRPAPSRRSKWRALLHTLL